MINNVLIADTKMSKLSLAISNFKTNHFTSPYLFANYATVMMMVSLANCEVECNRDYKTNCVYYKFDDCKLYIDDNIPFGMVDVR